MFIPDYRAAGRQKFCARPQCQKVRRRESQRRWLAKTGNAAYHSGDEPARRVREWRAAHPGYWRRRTVQAPVAEPVTLESLLAPFALQDACPALQDAWSPQVIALVGLIAWVRGTALQNAIADDLRDIMFAGRAILNDLRVDAKK
ncbi:MAG: hypothetical protein ACKODK_08220 [Opitutaceae bacterium]